MKILITGARGQLGHDIQKEAEKRNLEADGVDIQEMDITDPEAVAKVIENGNYDAVIHCAAWTAVDKAEDPDLQPKVFDVNVNGTRNIAEVCSRLDIPMLYFSTDYVFDGQGEEPWQEDGEKNPLNYYGVTKALGEDAVTGLDKHFIIRISWVFGENGNNFIKTMLKLSENHDVLTVVDDQIGLPTYTKDLARLAVDMIQSDKYGIYQATNSGDYISWYDFARAIFEEAEVKVKVLPVDSSHYPSAAKRPANSRMAQGKLAEAGFEPLRPWQEAMADYVAILKNSETVR